MFSGKMNNVVASHYYRCGRISIKKFFVDRRSTTIFTDTGSPESAAGTKGVSQVSMRAAGKYTVSLLMKSI